MGSLGVIPFHSLNGDEPNEWRAGKFFEPPKHAQIPLFGMLYGGFVDVFCFTLDVFLVSRVSTVGHAPCHWHMGNCLLSLIEVVYTVCSTLSAVGGGCDAVLAPVASRCRGPRRWADALAPHSELPRPTRGPAHRAWAVLAACLCPPAGAPKQKQRAPALTGHPPGNSGTALALTTALGSHMNIPPHCFWGNHVLRPKGQSRHCNSEQFPRGDSTTAGLKSEALRL